MKRLLDDSDIASLPHTGRDPCIYWGKRKFGVRVYETLARTFVLAFTDGNGKKRLLNIARRWQRQDS
jgi:hypothetical protein